ncbi:MAG: hypothetical protein ISS15_14595 [Alphaproteobacteria bacterium]|nr:hypothetical protein [Alphaproteobacteria bacterium]MBL7098884.1 hypothetical protein [Alphaproteobacteria bacterium]
MTTHTLGYETRTIMRFFIEMVGAVGILLLVSFAAHHAPVPRGTTAYTLIQLLPIPAVWLLPLAMLRHYLRLDELQRLKLLQSISLTAGILAGAAWSLPALHSAFGWTATDDGMWEVWFSVVFVVITALVQQLRAR